MKHFVIFFTTICFLIVNTDSCYTPDNVQGTCKSIRDCQIFVDIIQKAPLNNNTVAYLRKTQCGFSGGFPMVCCPRTTTPFIEGLEFSNSTETKLLPASNVCGIFAEDRIIHGQYAEIGHFPWTALLEYETWNGTKEFYCGGSLISNRYILTAAHCAVGHGLPKDIKLISVRLGDHNLQTDPDCESFFDTQYCSNPAVNILIEESIVHESYKLSNPSQNNDIALLRLKNKVQFSDFISPVCLPTKIEYSLKRLRTAGWGTYNKKPFNFKRKQGVVIEKNSLDCNSLFNLQVEEGQFCGVKEKNTDACNDDIGGALLGINGYQHYALGILSFGPSSCNSEINVYTDVRKYVNWIISKLKE